VVVVVVVVQGTMGISIKFVHRGGLSDITLIMVVPLGTSVLVYPAKRDALATPVSKAPVYPSTSEYRLKGPVSDPATVSVIVTIMVY
jgi:hypothetical protein